MKRKTKNPKLSPLAKDLRSALQEVKAHMRGESTLEVRVVQAPEKVGVSKIRKQLGLSQRKFAESFGFSVRTVQEWESGRRTPERTARILMALIAKQPDFVARTLQEI